MDNVVLLPDSEVLAVGEHDSEPGAAERGGEVVQVGLGWAEWAQADIHAGAAPKAALIERELALRQQSYDRIQSTFARTPGR
jgi:hypothetical protein